MKKLLNTSPWGWNSPWNSPWDAIALYLTWDDKIEIPEPKAALFPIHFNQQCHLFDKNRPIRLTSIRELKTMKAHCCIMCYNLTLTQRRSSQL